MGATPNELFPRVIDDGINQTLGSPAQIFHTEKLTDEQIAQFYPFVAQMMNLLGNDVCSLGRPEDTMSWLSEWYDSVSSWVDTYGLLLPAPIQSGEEGMSACGYINRESPDHIDAPNNMPVGLSIGLFGVRELVGISFNTPEECAELLEQLHADGKRLRDYDSLNGNPVERVVQRPWDVTHIATYATVHSGGHAVESDEGSDALAIGFNGEFALDFMEQTQQHIDTIYRPGVMGRLHEEARRHATPSEI